MYPMVKPHPYLVNDDFKFTLWETRNTYFKQYLLLWWTWSLVIIARIIMANGILCNCSYVQNNEKEIRNTQRKKLIETTKRVLLSTFWLFWAKFVVEVNKRICCKEKKNIVNNFTKFQQNLLHFISINKIFSLILQ